MELMASGLALEMEFKDNTTVECSMIYQIVNAKVKFHRIPIAKTTVLPNFASHTSTFRVSCKHWLVLLVYRFETQV